MCSEFDKTLLGSREVPSLKKEKTNVPPLTTRSKISLHDFLLLILIVFLVCQG